MYLSQIKYVCVVIHRLTSLLLHTFFDYLLDNATLYMYLVDTMNRHINRKVYMRQKTLTLTVGILILIPITLFTLFAK